jgi:CRISPR-associated protein Cmr4
MFNYIYLYLLAPLHTGGTTQEGNLVGIARESHTQLPYIPSSSIRGRLRASISNKTEKFQLFGNELNDSSSDETNNYDDEKTTKSNSDQLTQGDLWIGDGSLLWLPVPSLSHGVVWISSPMLLRRWAKFNNLLNKIPDRYSCSFAGNNSPVYLKDAIIQGDSLQAWQDWKEFIPQSYQTSAIERVLVLPDNHCSTLIQMSLWRQVKINLKENKTVKDGSFRYEEAIPPDTLMYFPWGVNHAANGTAENSREIFTNLITQKNILQIGGQESLGRGFVQQWMLSES